MPDEMTDTEANAWREEMMLAEANLARMRSQWDKAEARCIDIMRANPNSHHAHSLLGDIFRDQGRLEEAAQWYQLALDLNPKTPAAPAKLAEIKSKKELLFANKPTWRSNTPSVGTQKLIGITPQIWLKGLLALSVVFMVVVILILVTAGRNSKNKTITSGETISTSDQGTQVAPFSGPAPKPNSPVSTIKSSRDIATNGSTPETPRVTQPTETTVNALSGRQMYSPAPQIGQTAQEASIYRMLTRSDTLPGDLTVFGVNYDDREQHVTITLLHSAAPNVPVSTLKEAAVANALRTAQTVFVSDNTIQTATMVIRIIDARNIAIPIFEGDIESRTAMSLPANIPMAQALNAFTNVH